MGLFTRQPRTSGLCCLDNCNNSEGSSRRFIRTNEAPYQMIGERTLAATLGYKELSCSHFWLSLLSECLSCYLYVFIVCSTRISWTGAIIGHEPNLLAMSLSSGIAMMLLIFTFRTVHVNPALTISFLMTGRVPVIRAILYIVAHCIGSIAAIAFLYSVSIKGHSGALGLDNPHEILSSWQILIVEIVISFVVTLTTYATCNYSSYTCAKRYILDQLGQSQSLFQSSFSCDNPIASSEHRHSRRSVAPIVPSTNTNFRTNIHQASKRLNLNSYHENVNTNYDYEYDNHRIYATQKLKSTESSSPQVPIEELMQDECHLLAPNGFALHVTSGQAIVIGLAYTLTSLCGIPASGASLNPARSLGPAFIMNRWDLHWIYWLGPILGAVVAGFFYEFIFNPTRNQSLCYRPKLFRLSAQDMARVGSRSRLYQQQHQQKLSPVSVAALQPSTTLYRPQIHNQTIHHSPTTRASASNLITGSGLMGSSIRDPQSITTSTSVAHLQSSYPISNTFDQMNYFQQQLEQQQHQQQIHSHSQIANFERNKPSAIVNSMGTTKQHQSSMNLPQRNDNDLATEQSKTTLMDGPNGQVVYDDPNIEQGLCLPFRSTQQLQGHSIPMANQHTSRRAVIAPSNLQQRFEFGLVAPNNNMGGQSNNIHQATLGNRKQFNDLISSTNPVTRQPFHTVGQGSKVANRPFSIALDQVSFQQQQQQQHQLQHNGGQYISNDQLDDDLYNVLNEQSHGNSSNQPGSSLEYANNVTTETSDSSQRTNEMSSSGQGCERAPINVNGTCTQPRDYDHEHYYN